MERQKVDGKFWLGERDRPAEAAGPFDGLLDLFEHTYEPGLTFWFGVAEVTCTTEAFREMSRVPELFVRKTRAALRKE